MKNFLCIAFFLALPAFGDGLIPLTAAGKNIVTTEGQVVSMRGINIGNWFMMETWIPSFGITWEAHLTRLASEAGIKVAFDAAIKMTGKFDDALMTYGSYMERLCANLVKDCDEKRVAEYWAHLEREPPITDAHTLDSILRKRYGEDGANAIWEAFHKTWITAEDLK